MREKLIYLPGVALQDPEAVKKAVLDTEIQAHEDHATSRIVRAGNACANALTWMTATPMRRSLSGAALLGLNGAAFRYPEFAPVIDGALASLAGVTIVTDAQLLERGYLRYMEDRTRRHYSSHPITDDTTTIPSSLINALSAQETPVPSGFSQSEALPSATILFDKSRHTR